MGSFVAPIAFVMTWFAAVPRLGAAIARRRAGGRGERHRVRPRVLNGIGPMSNGKIVRPVDELVS